MTAHLAFATALHRLLASRWTAARARPGIRLRHAADGEAPSGYLCGDPPLPAGEEWPGDEYGEPMEHLLTVDLAALPPIGLDLPSGGRLSFFVSADADEGRVIHTAADTPPRRAPEPVRYASVPVVAVVEPTYPSTGYVDDESAGIPMPRFAAAYLPEPPQYAHRIGGYGDSVQYDTDFAPSSAPVMGLGEGGVPAELPVMLAQIETDDEAGIGWGDCGNSHWLITREDLAAGRFDRAWMVWSCF